MPPSSNAAAGSTQCAHILSTDDLAAGMLTAQVQRSLFNGQTLINPQIGTVAITAIFPVRSGQDGKLVFFTSFSAQVQGLQSSDRSKILGGYSVQAIVTWCDPNAAASCRSQTAFYAPCSPLCTQAIIANDPTCGGTCRAGLDQAIALARQGTWLALMSDSNSDNGYNDDAYYEYLTLSSATITGTASTASTGTNNNNDNNDHNDANVNLYYSLNAQKVWVHPYQGVSLAQSFTSSVSPTYYRLSDDSKTLITLGAWTRAQVFSLMPSAPAQKPIRDAWAHMPLYSISNSTTAQPILIPYFFQATTSSFSAGLVGQWLSEIRPQFGPLGWQLLSFHSQTTSSTANLELNCTYLSCTGCSTARLRLLCAQAQNCVLSNCVGTTVQTRNVLCGIGSVLNTASRHAINTWRAIHLALAELALLAMRGLSGEIVGSTVTLQFPTDGFYTLMCSCKDTFASMVALGISVGNALLSSLNGGGSVINIALSGQQDVGALAGQGVLQSTSIAGLIFNTVSSSTLLPTLALHRWLLCTVNASLAGNGFSDDGTLTIQFGDVGMDKSWMPCAKLEGLRSIISSDDMTTASGNAVTMFVQFTLSLVSGIGQTVLYAMELSFTATIDFFIGLVWSLQVCMSLVLYCPHY